MKLLSTVFTIFAVLPFATAGDGGCGMGAGTALANCLGIGNDCSKLKAPCNKYKSVSQRAKCFCAWYTKAANCWKAGTCCTEYPAHAAGAARVCKVAKQKKPSAKALASAVAVAQGVVNQVCHNDCGYDIPCLPEEPAPHNPGGGNCQGRSYWSNGKCTGRRKCSGRLKLRRDGEPYSQD